MLQSSSSFYSSSSNSSTSSRSILTSDDIIYIRRLIREGVSHRQITSLVRVGMSRIKKIAIGQLYPDLPEVIPLHEYERIMKFNKGIHGRSHRCYAPWKTLPPKLREEFIRLTTRSSNNRYTHNEAYRKIGRADLIKLRMDRWSRNGD
jgi:hypothetical protein